MYITVSWTPWNLSFCNTDCTGQFTPKMKANAEPRLLSSWVWIDSGVVVSQHRLASFFMNYNVTKWQVSWNSWKAFFIWKKSKFYEISMESKCFFLVVMVTCFHLLIHGSRETCIYTKCSASQSLKSLAGRSEISHDYYCNFIVLKSYKKSNWKPVVGINSLIL